MKIARHKILTRAEEVALVRRFKAGDRKAGEELLEKNQKFAAQQAWKWATYGIPVEDLLQEANVGMLRALEKFDPERGVRFITFAVTWISAMCRQRIMADLCLVKAATTQQKRNDFFRNATALKSQEVSLETPLSDGLPLASVMAAEGPTAEEVLAAYDRRVEIGTEVRHALAALDDRERFVVVERVMSECPMTLQELGDHFGFSRETARNIETRALAKLRKHLAGLEAA